MIGTGVGQSWAGLEFGPGDGSVATIEASASDHCRMAETLRHRGIEVRRAIAALEGESSRAVDSLTERCTHLDARFDAAAEAALEVSAVLRDYARSLETLRARERTLHSEEPPCSMVGLPGSSFEQWSFMHHAYDRLLEERAGLDGSTVRRLGSISLARTLTSMLREETADARSAAAAIWAGEPAVFSAAGLAGLRTPTMVLRAWRSLSTKERSAMISSSPLVIGNLDGIPLADRAAANRITLVAEVARLEDQRDREAAILATPMTTSPVADRAAAALRLRIDSYRELLAAGEAPCGEPGLPMTRNGGIVIAFDPARSIIATYHGPLNDGGIPDTVQHVAVFVPGTRTDVTRFESTDRVGANLAVDSGATTAVIAWAGGRFPQDLVEAADASYSETLGPRLRTFVAALGLPDGADTTVIGHSYGSAIVGKAEQAGLDVDRVVYVAGAGLGHNVRGLSDYPFSSGAAHFSLMARHDAVVGGVQDLEADLGGVALGHGASPLHTSGIARLETGRLEADNADSGMVDDAGPIESHSAVLRRGSTSYENIVNVITGNAVEPFVRLDHGRKP